MRQPIGFCHFGGCRRWIWPWWVDLFEYATRYFWLDCYRFYHRGRYGYSDIDSWGGQHEYLAKVMSGMLYDLAQHAHGTPMGYPDRAENDGGFGADCMQRVTLPDDPPETDHELWKADLLRWAQVFEDFQRDDYVDLYCTDDLNDLTFPELKGGSKYPYRVNYDAWHKDEAARTKAMHDAWKEIEPWIESLWD